MKLGRFARCARKPTTPGIIKPADNKPRCKTPAKRRRRVNILLFIDLSSSCADRMEHRQNDTINEKRMKQPESRHASNEHNKAPAFPPGTDPQPSAGLAAFEKKS